MKKRLRKTTTWRGNFRRASTRIFTAMGALGVIQWLPDLVTAVGSTMHLWEPILSQPVYAGVQTLLAAAGVVTRNLARSDAEEGPSS